MAAPVSLRRAARVLAAWLVAFAALPGAATAAPPEFTCEALTSITFSADLPAGMRTVGTHGINWRLEFVDAETGDLVDDDSAFNEITIDPAAPAYPNTVLIRVFRNTTLVSNRGDFEDLTVEAMQPTQAAKLHVAVTWVTNDKFFIGDVDLEFRYETSPGSWTPFQAITAGPAQSFCVEDNLATWKKQYGWD